MFLKHILFLDKTAFFNEKQLNDNKIISEWILNKH